MDWLYVIFENIFGNLIQFLALFTQTSAIRGRKNEIEMLTISVKYKSTRDAVRLQLQPNLTISEVKRKLIEQLKKLKSINEDFNKEQLATENLVIIFAGKELNDETRLSDYDLGQNSVVHAVQLKNKSTHHQSDLTILSQLNLNEINSVESSELEVNQNEKRRKSYFFVYCSSKSCKSINPGKLRVCCKKCKESSLIVSKDPGCWDDVIEPDRIPGECQQEHCDGTIAQFYFKCASTDHRDHDNDETNLTIQTNAVPLSCIRYNTRNVVCLACMDIAEIVFVFPCEHVLCYDCYKNYCYSKLSERQFELNPVFGYTLSCPLACENSCIREIHHFRIFNNDEYEKYQRFAAEECLLSNGGVLCPRPDCGAGMIIEVDNSIGTDSDCRRIVCSICNYVFCRECLQGYHIGDCLSESTSVNQRYNFSENIDLNNADDAKWETEQSLRLIKDRTKPCPKCRTPTERNGGCMHIICTRPQCGFNWCWICQIEWSRSCMSEHWFG